MLWTVRHRWANGSRFAMNCYRHSAQLILRRRGKDCAIILSREGVTQGDPLSMVLYGLSLTPLAEALRRAVPTIVQPWYADDAAMAGPVTGIRDAQQLLLTLGPQRGYYPEPEKSVLIAPASAAPDDPLPRSLNLSFSRRQVTATLVGSSAQSIPNWPGSSHRSRTGSPASIA